jgi:transcriptional regulator with XRE-family HTH domain
VQGSLAYRLRVLRAERGLTLREAASLTGVAKETISDIERGLRHPHDPTLAKIAKGYGVPVGDLLEEPALAAGKAEAPDQGRPETSTQTIEESERAFARVLEPVRTEALQAQQAANRFLSSEGRKQDRVVDLAEAEAGKRFVEEFSPDQISVAAGELLLGYARLERDNANLQEGLTRAKKLLREHGEKIAQLEQENAQLKAEGEREGIRR